MGLPTPEIIISLGGLVLGGLLAMKPKAKTKWIGGLLLAVSAIVLVVSIFGSDKSGQSAGQAATTYGNNSPVINQSISMAGGTSVIYQAAGNLTINYAPSLEAMRDTLVKQETKWYSELIQRFPLGFVLFGVVANGRVVAIPKMPDGEIRGDWDNTRVAIDTTNRTAQIFVPYVYVSNRAVRAWTMEGNTERFFFTEDQNTLQLSGGIPNMFYQVLNATNAIFVMGFK
jgi:hypothetical protein